METSLGLLGDVMQPLFLANDFILLIYAFVLYSSIIYCTPLKYLGKLQ